MPELRRGSLPCSDEYPCRIFEVCHAWTVDAQISQQLGHLHWLGVVGLEVNVFEYKILDARLGTVKLVALLQLRSLIWAEKPVLLALDIHRLLHLRPELLHIDTMVHINPIDRYHPEPSVAAGVGQKLSCVDACVERCPSLVGGETPGRRVGAARQSSW